MLFALNVCTSCCKNIFIYFIFVVVATKGNMMRLMNQLAGREQQLFQQSAPTNDDPFDLEAQKRMLEAIRLDSFHN